MEVEILSGPPVPPEIETHLQMWLEEGSNAFGKKFIILCAKQIRSSEKQILAAISEEGIQLLSYGTGPWGIPIAHGDDYFGNRNCMKILP